MTNDNTIEQENQALGARVGRLKRHAIAGWACCVLAIGAGVLLIIDARKVVHAYQKLIMVHEEVARHKETVLMREMEFMKSRLETEHLTALVLKLGGRIEENDDKVVAVDLSNTKATDADLAELKELPSLKTLNLKGTRVSAAGVQKLKAKLPGLMVLR